MKKFNKTYGAGNSVTKKLIIMHGLKTNNKISEQVKISCTSFLKNKIPKEEVLKKGLIDIINYQIENNTYKGYRHKIGLPVNGQNTHNNRKTQRALYKKRLHL